MTSFKVRGSVLAMYYVLMGEGTDPQAFVLDTVNKIVDKWEGDSAKGLSQFVMDTMLESMLEKDDLPLYRTVMKRLETA